MTRDQFIERVLGTRLIEFFEFLKAQHPDLATTIDPKIAELRGVLTTEVLGNVVGEGLTELQRLLETAKLDPRQHPSDLA